MRTSRVSKETTKVLEALSPSRKRVTRSSLTARTLRTFEHSARSNRQVPTKIESEAPSPPDEKPDSLSSSSQEDIEDLLNPRPSKRRRGGSNTPPTSLDTEPSTISALRRTSGAKNAKEDEEIKGSMAQQALSQETHKIKSGSPPITSVLRTSVKVEESIERKPIATRKHLARGIKQEDSNSSTSIKPEGSREERKPTKERRQPARKIKGGDGSVAIAPPSNWEKMYDIVKEMRAKNPTAPVDTMGCAELHWRASSPRDQRFQTLVALMLSSQTKDTVTAVAMQRLHTELADQNPVPQSTSEATTKVEDGEGKKAPVQDSTLKLENILAIEPHRLNELIRTVGFHNNKTKYIKAAAIILRDQYNSDIPSTAEELMKLPGVGPKMAYLCMSAAWGKHEGIGVDVHVHRITNLWGWHKTKNPEETRIALQSWLPRDKWHEINKLLVGLGQTACLPVGRRCGECDLAGTRLCKSEIKGWVPKRGQLSAKREEENIDGGVTLKDEPQIKVEVA